MYMNILVPVAADHDKHTGKALNVARALAGEGAKITVLTVVEQMPGYIAAQLPEGHVEKMREDLKAGLHEDLAGAEDVSVAVIDGHSARTILDYADSHEVDCIVMSSHRPDFSDYLLGSTAARVVRHARCAVHVMR